MCNPRYVWGLRNHAGFVGVIPARLRRAVLTTESIHAWNLPSGRGRVILEAKTVTMHAQSLLRAIQHSSFDRYISNESPSRAVSSAPPSRSRMHDYAEDAKPPQGSEYWCLREPPVGGPAITTEMKCLEPGLDSASFVRRGALRRPSWKFMDGLESSDGLRLAP